VLSDIQVISTLPLSGTGIDRDNVPALVQTVRSEDFDRSSSSNIIDTVTPAQPLAVYGGVRVKL
jgi:hypothetical protein